MSKIGKKLIVIPAGVEVANNNNEVNFKGKLGSLVVKLVDGITVSLDGVKLSVIPSKASSGASWGLISSLCSNAAIGVSEGFAKKLVITGVGYKAALKGSVLVLSLGYSHDINYEIPKGIDVKCASPTEILVSGFDKQLVGQVAAEIRSYRSPEPYKGKGVAYSDEEIVRKEGKKK